MRKIIGIIPLVCIIIVSVSAILINVNNNIESRYSINTICEKSDMHEKYSVGCSDSPVSKVFSANPDTRSTDIDDKSANVESGVNAFPNATKSTMIDDYIFESIEIGVDNAKNLLIETDKIIKQNKVKMIAHRGYSAIAPENSITSYKKAGEAGFYGGECDVAMTSDGHFVLMHDDTVDRTTNGTGTVSEMTLEEFKSCYIDSSNEYGEMLRRYVSIMPETPPTLEEYLIVCRIYNIVPVVELKSNIPIECISDLIDIVKEYDMDKSCIYISFKPILLEKIIEIDNDAHVQFLIDFNADNINYCASLGKNVGIDAQYTQITKELVDYAHSLGVEVNTWTCNDALTMRYLIKCGVDYITTNKLYIK